MDIGIVVGAVHGLRKEAEKGKLETVQALTSGLRAAGAKDSGKQKKEMGERLVKEPAYRNKVRGFTLGRSAIGKYPEGELAAIAGAGGISAVALAKLIAKIRGMKKGKA